MQIGRCVFRCTAAAAAAMFLASCATSTPSAYSVQPLYGSDAKRLSTVVLRVTGPREVITVLPPGLDGPLPSGMPLPAGTGVGVGFVGTTIAGGITDAIASAEGGQKAEEVKLRLSVLRDQVAALDYSSMVAKQVEQILVNPAQTHSRSWKLRSAKATGPADATLSVQVSETFLNWGIPRRPGVPLLPAGLLLYLRADVTLTAKDGSALLKDAVIFETPYSDEPYDDVRIGWWKEHDRFRHLLELSGRALAAGIEEQVIGTPRYESEAAFIAQRDADQRVPATERENRLDAVLEKFRHCDDFYSTPASETKFRAYRNEADGYVYVGIACAGMRQPNGGQAAATTPIRSTH